MQMADKRPDPAANTAGLLQVIRKASSARPFMRSTGGFTFHWFCFWMENL
jgi:hypothetical protein